MQTLKTIMLLLAVLFIAAACNEDSGGDASGCNSDSDCPDAQVCDMSSGQCVDESTTDGDSSEADLESDGDEETETEAEEIEVCPVPNYPDTVDMGAVCLDCSISNEFEVCNDGEAPLLLSSMRVIDELGRDEFKISLQDDEPPVMLDYGDCMEIQITYTPLDFEYNPAVLEINTNACNAPVLHIELMTGCKCSTEISVTPGSFDFGYAAVGGEPVEQEFSICNSPENQDSNLTLVIYGITPASGAWTHFECLSDICNSSPEQQEWIAPGQCQTMLLRYNPKLAVESGQKHSDVIELQRVRYHENDYTRIEISGTTEHCFKAHPDEIDFNAGKAVGIRQIELMNGCNENIEISQISLAELEGDDCRFFSVNGFSEGGALAIMSGESIYFDLSFMASESYVYTCHLDIASSAAEMPHLIIPIYANSRDEQEPPIEHND